MPASKPNGLPKAPPLNTVTLGVRALMYEFVVGENIQFITIIIIFVVIS